VIGTGLPIAGFENAVRVMRNRNYRLYTTGNSISLIGTWIQRIAVGWLAWQLTHSGVWLGLVAAADLIPSVAVSPFAGALADRADRVRVIQVSQILGMLQSWMLALLTYTDLITPELLFLLTLALGIVNAVNQPARLALIPNLVHRSEIGPAVAVNSLIFNNARFIGPATAGIVIAQGSVALAFTVAAVTYLAFIIALSRIVVEPDKPLAERRFFRESVEGYVYAMRHPGIGRMFMLFSVTTVALRGFIEMFPGFADRVFGRGPEGLAWLTATVGLGALVGGTMMLRRTGVRGLTSLIIGHTLLMSLAVIGFTTISLYWLALPCVFIAGYAMVVTGIGAQTLIQSSVDPAMRGRVMGFYGMLFRAGPALNALILGTLSAHFGLRMPMAAGAAVCVLAWGWARHFQGEIALSLETEAQGVAAE